MITELKILGQSLIYNPKTRLIFDESINKFVELPVSTYSIIKKEREWDDEMMGLLINQKNISFGKLNVDWDSIYEQYIQSGGKTDKQTYISCLKIEADKSVEFYNTASLPEIILSHNPQKYNLTPRYKLDRVIDFVQYNGDATTKLALKCNYIAIYRNLLYKIYDGPCKLTDDIDANVLFDILPKQDVYDTLMGLKLRKDTATYTTYKDEINLLSKYFQKNKVKSPNSYVKTKSGKAVFEFYKKLVKNKVRCVMGGGFILVHNDDLKKAKNLNDTPYSVV